MRIAYRFACAAILFLLVPLALAQTSATLTPTVPFAYDDTGVGAPFTTDVGKVTFALDFGDAKVGGSASLVAPGTITGTEACCDSGAAPYYKLNPPASFTIQQSITGASSVDFTVSNSVSVPGLMNNCSGTGPCSITAIDESQDHKQVFLSMHIAMKVGSTHTAGFTISWVWNQKAACIQTGSDVCFGQTIDIDHVEAVQSIQNQAGTAVPYIAGKLTLIRVFVDSITKDYIKGIKATVGGAIELNNSDYEARPESGRIRRGSIAASMNFVLFNPPEGTVNLPITVTTPTGDQVLTSKKIVFIRPPTVPDKFYLGYIPICVTDQNKQPKCPDNVDKLGDEIIRGAGSSFPFPDGTIVYFPIPVATPPIVSGFVGSNYTPFPDFDLRLSRAVFKAFVLLNVYPLPGVPRVDHLTAFIPGLLVDPGHPYTFHWYEELAQLGGFPSQISWQTTGSDGTTLSHRLGHQMGLKDHGGRIDELAFDVDFIYSLSNIFRDPETTGSIMDPSNDYLSWVSVADYNGILSKQVPIQPAAAAPAVESAKVLLQSPAANSSDYVVVSGTVQRDGSAAQLDPVYHVTTTKAQVPSQPSGNHCLQFSSASATLGQYCFDLDVTPAAGLSQQMFAVVAPWPAGTNQLKLVRNGKQLASVSAVTQDPVVTILSPKSGDRLQGAITITWSLSGASASSTVYTVLYSSDGGTSWLPLANDISDTQYALNTAQILGGTQVFFRVIAASGLNSGTATVGPIQINQTPRINATVSPLDFGNAIPNTGIARKIGITSGGSGPLTITNIAIDNPAFTLLTSKPVTPLVVGSTKNLTILMQTPAAGTVNGTLTINSNDPVTPVFKIPLVAQSSDTPAASVQIDVTNVEFGDVPLNQPADQLLSITNSGSADLTITSIRSSNGEFTVASPALPLTIPINASATVVLRLRAVGTGLRAGLITVSSNDPTHAAYALTATGTGVAVGNAPQISSGGVVNGASFLAPVARCGLATIFGSNLANGTASASQLPLPILLAGAQVKVGDFYAPLVYVSASQINFQVPCEAPLSGSTLVVVTRDGTPSTTQSVQTAEYAPAVFSYARNATTIDPVIVHADNRLVTPDNPASANEVLIIYATGVGSFDNPPSTGAASPSSPLAQALVQPTVTIGGAQAQVLFAGLTPGFVGLVQINIKLPATLPAGTSLPVSVQFPGVASQALNLSITGATSGSTDVTLKVDGGTFNSTLGFPTGVSTAVFVNRLTPPSYPATLKSVQIYFGNRSNGLAANTAISIVAASNPSGSTSFSKATVGVYNLVPANVGTLGGFTTYTVPAITITSGDFVVGFQTANPVNITPADLDKVTTSQQRSYSSGDGVTFSIIDSFGSGTAGNFGIRAVVTVGGTSGGGGGGGTGGIDTSNPLSTNLVGLFAMNEGSGTTDKNLVDSQLATFAGSNLPTWNPSDPSITFKGGAALNSYLNAGTDSAFDRLPVGQMTIVARIFANQVATAGICEKNDGNSADGFVFGTNGADGGLQLTMEKSSSNMRIETVAAVTAGKWMQVAVTWDGTRGNASDAHIFVNGVEQKYVLTNNGSGTLGFAGATNQPFRIGTAAFDFPGSFNGKMAYLAVYKGRILTPAEMTQLDAKLPVK